MSAPVTHEKQSLRLWLHIFSCAGVVERRIQNRFRERFSTTLPRFDVLAALQRAGKPISMGALSDLLLATGGNVTGIINRLQKDNLVVRTKDPGDARSHIVALSDLGHKYFAELASAHDPSSGQGTPETAGAEGGLSSRTGAVEGTAPDKDTHPLAERSSP